MQYLHNLEIVCTALTILFILALVALWVVIANSVRMGVLLDASVVEAERNENHLALLDQALHLDGLDGLNRLQRVRYLSRVYLFKGFDGLPPEDEPVHVDGAPEIRIFGTPHLSHLIRSTRAITSSHEPQV